MVEINQELVSSLIKDQFPQWADIPIHPVAKSGNDNRTFHLGCEMSVRLPSHERYASQVEKELFWLPRLRPHLSLRIPVPLGKGEPAPGYPWPWSVNRWVPGNTVCPDTVLNLNQLAVDLAGFLKELEAVDCSGGPRAGAHNFFRGGSLWVYNEETQTALRNLRPLLQADPLEEIWNLALQSEWAREPVWVHGDVAPGNLLEDHGKLCGVIDFGILGVGDPACDLTMAWTFFDDASRKIFFDSMESDQETRNRARGWTLWKALITYDRNDKHSSAAIEGRRIIDAILKEYEKTPL